MTAKIGREITLTWNGMDEFGVREKGISLAGEPIDISSDDSAGVRVLHDTDGESMVNISISGVTKKNVLRKDWFEGNRTRAVVVTFDTGETLTGNFRLVSYQDTGPYKEASTFEAELQSTGAWTYVDD